MSTAITVYQGNSPDVTFLCKVAGEETPYDLTGASLEFFQKASPGAADGTPTYTTTGGTIVVNNAAGGDVTVRMSSANLGTPGTFFYHLDAIVASRRQTIASGQLVVLDI